ncbi:MAG: hypothetical protein N2A40_06050 [Desulfobulbaceae bacterium]
MSIKLLAIELYRARQDVARLEAQCDALPLSAREDLLEELRQSRAELQLLRKMLDDKKDASTPPARCR